MSDEVEIKFEQPPEGDPWTSWEPEEDYVTKEETEEPTEEPTGPNREELEAEVERLKTSIAAAESRGDSVSAMTKSIEGLREALTQPTQPVQHPQESEEDFNKRYQELLIENPVAANEELMKRKLGPMLGRLEGALIKVTRNNVRRDNPETFGRYEAEIDREFQTMPYKDEDSYQKAHDLVVARHLSDLQAPTNEKIAQLEKEIEELKKTRGAPAKPAGPTYTPQQGPGPSSTRPKRVVSNYQRQKAGQIALRKRGSTSFGNHILATAHRMVDEGKAKDLDDALGRM